MNWLVRVWEGFGKDRTEDLHDFETLEEATGYADFKADQCRKSGAEFGILIYQLTNY